MQEGDKKNIYFWFGNDDFSMQESLAGEKQKMLEKSSSADINDFDFANTDNRFELEQKVCNTLKGSSLFSSEKLTVIRNFWSTQRKTKESQSDAGEEKKNRNTFEDFLIDYIDKINSDDKIFFLESRNMDKRSKGYKFFEELSKKGKIEKKEFTMPLGFKFNAWLEERIKKCGGKISKANLEFLAMLLGKGMEQKERGEIIAAYDLYQASSEIDKLIAYCDGKEIGKEDILMLVSGREDMNIFDLLESLGKRDKRRAISILSGQLKEGFNENYILTMLVYHFRNLIMIKSLINNGLGSGEIASRTKIHPMVVEKNIGYARQLKEENLIMIYEKLYSADLSIKTGKMEPELALDLLIAAI